MKIETFFDIEVNKSLLEVNTCFAILLLEIEAITYTVEPGNSKLVNSKLFFGCFSICL